MSQIGTDFVFYVDTALVTVDEVSARAVTATTCKVKTLSVDSTRAEISSASRCGISRRSGALSLGFTVTFEFEKTDAYYALLRNAFFVDNVKVFLAEVTPDLATGLGIAGNASITNFSESHATDAYAEVTVTFVFEAADFLVLEETSA